MLAPRSKSRLETAETQTKFLLGFGRGVRGDGREAPRLLPRQAGKILKYRCPQRASARI